MRAACRARGAVARLHRCWPFRSCGAADTTDSRAGVRGGRRPGGAGRRDDRGRRRDVRADRVRRRRGHHPGGGGLRVGGRGRRKRKEHDRSVLDLGLRDADGNSQVPDGFRGWSGSRQGLTAEGQDPVFITAAAAERGFVPGPDRARVSGAWSWAPASSLPAGWPTRWRSRATTPTRAHPSCAVPARRRGGGERRGRTGTPARLPPPRVPQQPRGPRSPTRWSPPPSRPVSTSSPSPNT